MKSIYMIVTTLLMLCMVLGCASTTHEQAITNATQNLNDANKVLSEVATSVSILAPIASAAAKQSGASPEVLTAIQQAQVAATQATNTLNTLNAAAAIIPPNTPLALVPSGGAALNAPAADSSTSAAKIIAAPTTDSSDGVVIKK